jgi:hypothetical protein
MSSPGGRPVVGWVQDCLRGRSRLSGHSAPARYRVALQSVDSTIWPISATGIASTLPTAEPIPGRIHPCRSNTLAAALPWAIRLIFFQFLIRCWNLRSPAGDTSRLTLPDSASLGSWFFWCRAAGSLDGTAGRETVRPVDSSGATRIGRGPATEIPA